MCVCSPVQLHCIVSTELTHFMGCSKTSQCPGKALHILRTHTHPHYKLLSPLSHIATMLKSQDHRVIIGKRTHTLYMYCILYCSGGVQMAVTLMEKLPSIFRLYFHREGVIYQLKALRDKPIKTLGTPKQEVDIPSSQASPPAQRTPTSTRRYVRILRFN